MKKLTYLLLLIPLLLAFGKNKKPQHSKYLTKSYVKVPEGKVCTKLVPIFSRRNSNEAKELGLDSAETQDYLLYKEECSEFYIYNTEVTNGNWKEFLSYLKQNARTEEYKANMLDTNVWRHRMAYHEPYVNYYYQHQAYSNYPAVGMTLEQAQAYARWLTEIFTLKNEGVIITFSVPTKKQWIRAARGKFYQHYPWSGQYLRNDKGVYLANFKDLGSRDIMYNQHTKQYQLGYISHHSFKENTTTSPAKSYYPNQFGVYNMSGNVAELVSDDTVAMGGSWNDTGYDVRVESEQPATEPRSTIGFRVVAVIE